MLQERHIVQGDLSEDYARYETANAEYNKNEQTLARLKAKRAEELAAEEEQRLKTEQL